MTNFDKNFEKLIRAKIQKKFPNDSIIGEEFNDKKTSGQFMWSIDPIDGTRAFVIGAPTWSNLVSLSYQDKSKIGLANFPELMKFYLNDKKYSYVFKSGKRKNTVCGKDCLKDYCNLHEKCKSNQKDCGCTYVFKKGISKGERCNKKISENELCKKH